jgi:non-ribosomal peptide synthetase component F
MANSTAVLDVDRTLIDHFERQVARVPDRVAAGDAARTFTYAEFDRAANHIARALLAHSATAGETVALVLGHEVRTIAAILGALKAGKVYVPLDPALPVDRLAYVLDDAQVGAVVTDARHAPALGALSGALPPVLDLDEVESRAPVGAPGLTIPTDALCQLLSCTSAARTTRSRSAATGSRSPRSRWPSSGSPR